MLHVLKSLAGHGLKIAAPVNGRGSFLPLVPRAGTGIELKDCDAALGAAQARALQGEAKGVVDPLPCSVPRPSEPVPAELDT